MKRSFISVVLGLGMTHLSFANALLSLCKTDQNIVASSLIGTWVLANEVDEMLSTGKSDLGDEGTVIFTEDNNSLQYFDLLERTGTPCAYLSGVVQLSHRIVGTDGKERTVNFQSPFVLTVVSGNPSIWFDERGFDKNLNRIKDLHRGFIMLAKGENKSKDLLFRGGDNNNQRMYAFKRKE